MSKKKILIVSTVCETFETILKGQPGRLAEHYSVYVACSGSAVNDFAQREGVCGGFNVPMVRGISPVRDIISIFLLIKVIMRVRPDVVHSYTPKAGLVAAIASFFIVPHRIHTFTGLIFPTSTGLKKRVLMVCDAVVCLLNTVTVAEGKGVSKDLNKVMPFWKDSIIIGNGNIAGVDIDYFSPVSSRNKKTNSAFIFSYIGRLTPDKGVSELVEAFLRLPEEASLIIAGALDDASPIQEELLSEIIGHPRIEYFGFLDDVRDVFSSSDVFVLPSYREGFPNVILQAGAMALPVIATNVNGANEIIVDDWNGWLVPARDADTLERVMRSTMRLACQTLHQIGMNGRNNVVSKYERERYMQELLLFYSGVLK